MMTVPRLEVPLFLTLEPRQLRYSADALTGLVFGLTLSNVAWLRSYPRTPALYSAEAGVRYTIEPEGEEHWQSIPAAMASKRADCEDLAAWRSAELRARGIDARPGVVFRVVDNRVRAHAFVILPDGSTEDPSEVLGMRPLGLHRPGRPWPRRAAPQGLWQPPPERRLS